MPQKVVAVVGATGAQGGGLARAILADPASGFSVRAITRHVDSEKAKALASAGAEVVAADLDDSESLKKAFAGAEYAFCVTNYWEHMSPAKEISQVRFLAEAASHARVKHAIWSTLDNTLDWVPLTDDRMPTLHGKYKVPHFDTKGFADQFFRARKVPTTYLLTSFYWENFIGGGAAPQRGADHELALVFPLDETRLPGIAAEDIGRCALGVFKRPDLIGKTIGIAGEHLTGAEMAAAMSKGLGMRIGYTSVEADAYRSSGFPGADDIGNMFQFKRDFNDYYTATRDVDLARSLNPALQSFDQWLETHKQLIPIPA